FFFCFFFSSRRRHTRCLSDWSSDVCSSDLVISSPQNLRALDRYRELNAKLADPRGFKTAKEAEDVLRGGKTIVLITSGIHSTEVGGHLSPAVLAYRLASDTSLATRAILDNVILWLVPSRSEEH